MSAVRFCNLSYRIIRHKTVTRRFLQVRELCALAQPPSDATKVYPQKIHDIVQDIAGLTLKETAQLNELLKETLNISDAPLMAAAPAAPSATTEAESEKKEEQTEFNVTLVKFNDASKIKLIKKIKEVMEGLNLVQAKKLVESVPQLLKENISKEEAMKLKSDLEAEGGEVTVK